VTLIAVAGYIVGSIGVVAAIAAAVAVFKSKVDERTLALWKENAEAEKARGDRMSDEIAALRNDFATYRTETDAKIHRLEIENATLKELIPNKAAFESLVSRIESNHSAVMAAINAGATPVIVNN
jgi:hypothetical protein